MEGFGRFLQQAREREHLSLEDVASQTRIQQKYLEALESEDFADLPGKVFAKGFVRSYAKTIGLDEEDTLQRFLDSSRNFYEQNHLEQQHHKTLVQAEHRGKFNRNLVLGLFVILGMSLFYFLPSQQQSTDTPPEPDLTAPQRQLKDLPLSENDSASPDSISSDVDSTVDNAKQNAGSLHPPGFPDEEPSSLEASPTSGEIPDQPNPASQPVPTQEPKTVEPSPHSLQTGSHTLEIEATQLTWVVVRSDDQPPNEALLQPGQRITWKAAKQFLLTLGNAAGVAVRLDGEPQGPFGKPGQVVRDILIKP